MADRKIRVTLEVTVSDYTHKELAEEGMNIDEVRVVSAEDVDG